MRWNYASENYRRSHYEATIIYKHNMGSLTDKPELKLDLLLSSLPPDTAENAGVRENMLVGARNLLLALERPDNVVERICFGVSGVIIFQP
jgi:hypothetical protein